MNANQRINANGKRFLAGSDLTGLSAEELALIPAAAIDGESAAVQGPVDAPTPPAPVTFKPIDKLNKADVIALATSMKVEVGEDDTKAIIGAKIDARIAALPAEVKDQSRNELIDSFELHFEGAEPGDAIPHFADMRDEELKVLLAQIMFVNLGEE